MSDKVFTKRVTVSGSFNSHFVFETADDVRQWLATDFIELNETYDDLTFKVTDLDGLKIGDKCHVIGDGNEEYTIIGIQKYSLNRYAFLLDSGFMEEVAKCYSVES
jgi:hypothetical protein